MSINSVIKCGMWSWSKFLPGILLWYLFTMVSLVTVSPSVDSFSLYKDHESIIIVLFLYDSDVSGEKLYRTRVFISETHSIINLKCACFTLTKVYLGKSCQIVAIWRIWLPFNGKYGYSQAHNHVENAQVLHFWIVSAALKHRPTEKETGKEKMQDTKHFACLPSDK